jgi:membrane protease YdiL (CAAX protease family)
VANVDDRELAATGMWVCSCGYANVGVRRCDMCRAPAAAAVKTSTVLRPPQSPEPVYGRTAPTAGPRPTPIYAPPALVILVIGVVAGNYAYQHGMVSVLEGRSQDVALLAALLGGLLFYLATWIVASTVARAVKVSPRFDREPGWAVAHGLWVGGIAAAAGAAVAFSSKGRAALDPTAVLLIDDGRWTALLVGVLVLVVAAPLAEEYVFRGLLTQAVAEHNRSVALWISSAAFAAAHLSPVRFFYYFLMGSMLGRLYLRRGLLASITAHALFNGAVLATAAIVVVGSSGTVHADGLRLTLPSGWHEVGAPDGEDLAATGPGGALLEVLHEDAPPGAVLSVDAAVSLLASSPMFDDVLVQGSSAHTRSTGAGPAAEAEITSATQSGFVVVLVGVDRIHVVVAHAPNGTDVSVAFEAMLASARLE